MMNLDQLTGDQLLARVNELREAGHDELTIINECGYYETSKSGNSRANKGAFYAALSAANGYSLTPRTNNRGRPNAYTVSVHKGGSTNVSPQYLREAGFEQGDQLKVTVSEGEVRLTRA